MISSRASDSLIGSGIVIGRSPQKAEPGLTGPGSLKKLSHRVTQLHGFVEIRAVSVPLCGLVLK